MKVLFVTDTYCHPFSSDLSLKLLSFFLGSKYRPIMVDFLLPESDKDGGENPIVDSLAVVSEWTIVAKCALHGLIYMWDLKVNIIRARLGTLWILIAL